MRAKYPFDPNNQFHQSSKVNSELDLLKAINDFMSSFGVSTTSDTLTDLITEYTLPIESKAETEPTRKHLHDTVFYATQIMSFLVKVDRLYDQYIHFHPERIERIENHK